MHVANPDHMITVWWPPVLSCIFSSLCFPIPSPLFPIFAPVSHPSASWTMPGEQIWWPPLFSLWRRSLIASPPSFSSAGQQWGTKRWEISPPAPRRPATCNIHILTSGSPTKLPSWIKRVWWLWEAIKSYEGSDFESQEQWLVQSGNLKLSKSGWWPNSKQKYIVDIALVALTEKHTNSQLANFHHLQQWTLAPPSFQPCICCPIRLLVYAKYLYVSQNCICCPGIGWDLSSDCHRHIWMCWCRTKRGGGIGAPARQWGQSTGVKIAKLVYIYIYQSKFQLPNPPIPGLTFCIS